MLQFNVPFAGVSLCGDRWTPPVSLRTVLLLHGGGTSSAAGFHELRSFLLARGVETLAFDFVGHGRSGGHQLGTTLRDRVQQVLAVIESQRLELTNLALVGFSMGAYVAVKAAVAAGVKRLCLAIPAAYAPEAYDVPFGNDFSRVIRAPRSWENSDAFQLISDYSGHLLVVSAENDQVVPSEIPHRYALPRSTSASTVHHIVKGSGHNLSEHYMLEPSARMSAYAEIASLCMRGDA